MIAFQPTPRAEMLRRAATVGPKRRAAPPGARNVATVLTLDGVEYFQFRGRAYRLPPIAWRDGEELLFAYTAALEAARRMESAARDREPADAAKLSDFYRSLEAVARILWRLSTPASRTRRVLRRLGLARNPFAAATERELLELADFFCARRMRSGVTFRPTADPRDRATSWTN